ncbi:MAG TPA: hypothetical protein VJ327_00935, partial [Patescibacteria group bacterium]|nr:hypothetical protein [Patescibacteria group bacterium]
GGNMFVKKFRNWVGAIKLKYAFRWLEGRGLSVVRIVEKAGTKYIVAQNGAFYKIGKRKPR